MSALAAAPAVSSLGTLEGTIHLSAHPDGASARPAQPFVAYLTGFVQEPPADIPTIAQRQKTFVPSLQVIVAGQSVRFTNDDPVVHNVFSTSKSRSFDLGKPSPGQTREVKFSTPGLVEVFCNIHEAMWASVLVLPNRAFAVADAAGHFVIRGVPPGPHTLYVWGREAQPFQTEVQVAPGQRAQVEVTVQPRLFNPAHLDKFGRPYRARAGYSP